jgi:hypothetical protein
VLYVTSVVKVLQIDANFNRYVRTVSKFALAFSGRLQSNNA